MTYHRATGKLKNGKMYIAEYLDVTAPKGQKMKPSTIALANRIAAKTFRKSPNYIETKAKQTKRRFKMTTHDSHRWAEANRLFPHKGTNVTRLITHGGAAFAASLEKKAASKARAKTAAAQRRRQKKAA